MTVPTRSALPVEVTTSELNEPAIATPPTDPSPTASDEDEAEPEQNDTAEAEAEYEPEPEESDTAEPEADNLAEDEMPPVEPIAVAESPTDVDVDAEETPVDAVPDEATRHYWRRSDDDILYRPSRRPRSPRRAWRDRITSRG